MIVTISGDAGSGKSTCAKGLANALGLKHYSSGDLMRQIAIDRALTLEELCKEAELSNEIDAELDKRQENLGKTEDNFIIDGRLSAYFIPHAVKVFLIAPIEERAKRIFKDNRDIEHADSIEKTIEMINNRRKSEEKRYLAWYNFNPYNLDEYNIVYDTFNKDINRMIVDVKKLIIDHQV